MRISARDGRGMIGSIEPVPRLARVTGLRARHDLTQGAAELGDQRRPPVLEHQRPEVTGVEELDSETRVQLAQPADLAVLLANESLLERRELDEELQIGQVEVRREALQDIAVEVPKDREDARFVLPGDLVEVQDAGELGLAGVGKGIVGSQAASRCLVGHDARPMLSFSGDRTLQVYPFGAFRNVRASAGALLRILPGGIIDRTGSEDDLPGQIDTTSANVERTIGATGTGDAIAAAATSGAAAEGLDVGSDSAQLDSTFQHSYSRDQSILIRRLRRIEGQVRGIERMIERREYCIDILQQTAALRAAVDSVALLILEDHVQGCVRTAAEQGNADRYIEEVLDVVRRTLGKPVRNPRV